MTDVYYMLGCHTSLLDDFHLLVLMLAWIHVIMIIYVHVHL